MKAFWTIAKCLFFVFICSSVKGQDVHLSQFYLNDLNLNPSYTGQYDDGNWRFTGNYRNQWAQVNDNALVTFMLGVEKKFSVNQHDIGIGLLLIRDQFDQFQTNLHKFQLSGSYGLNFGKNQKFTFGIQAGGLQRQVDLSNNVFGEQWDRSLGEFSQDLPSLDRELLGDNENELDIDINAGIGWRARFNKLAPQIGFTAQHINQPEDSYFNVDPEKLAIRYVGDIGLTYYVSPYFQIEPKGLLQFTTNTKDLVYGSNFRYVFANRPKHLSIYVGAFNRGDLTSDNDAIIPKIGAKIDRLELGASFDYNTSTLSDFARQKSSIEFGVRYTTGSNKPGIVSSPCEIF